MHSYLNQRSSIAIWKRCQVSKLSTHLQVWTISSSRYTINIDTFTKFFNSIFTIIEYRLPASLPTPSLQVSFVNVTARETFEALSTLDITKATCCDKLTLRVLKACATSLSEPVPQLFNRSMTFSELPTVCKCIKIMPIRKSGDLSKIK